MSAKYKFILIVTFLIYGRLFSQIDYDQLIDTSELSMAELKNMKNINTEFLEFSPAFYHSGLVYVSSMPEHPKSKIDKNIGESFFVLKYAQFDDSLNIVQNIDFLPDMHVNYHTGPCVFSDDFKHMILSKNSKSNISKDGEKNDVNPQNLYVYKNENDMWISEKDFPLNSYGYKIFHPAWDEMNHRLIFASDMPGGYGETDLYSIKMTENGWTDLKNLGPMINTPFKESFPFIYESKFLFYASNMPGGSGGIDIYFSDEISSQFQKPVNLGKVFNTEFDDFGLIISKNPNLCFFTSSRPGGMGKDDIYMLRSTQSVFRLFNNYFTIFVSDINNSKPLENAKIIFSKYELEKNQSPKISKFRGIDKDIIYSIDTSSLKDSKAVFTDISGKNNIYLPEGSYIAKIFKQGYQTYSGIFNSGGNNRLLDIKMDPEIIDTFMFSFINGDSKEIIPDLDFEIVDGNPVDVGKVNDNIYFISVKRGENIIVETESKEFYKKKIEIGKNAVPKIFDILLDPMSKYVTQLPTEVGESLILRDILYDYNSYLLDVRARKELDRLTDHLRKHPELKIELSSHTDSRGNEEFNQVLSMKRSENAKKYLEQKGIKSNRIIASGYGESKLKNECDDNHQCTETQHAENRRTEVKVIK
jgi:outer membrane protein OmpA-like peptidoglycan-associated protein